MTAFNGDSWSDIEETGYLIDLTINYIPKFSNLPPQAPIFLQIIPDYVFNISYSDIDIKQIVFPEIYDANNDAYSVSV